MNERGEILSVPNEKFGTTTQYDPVLNLAASLYDKAQQEQADIDLDRAFIQTYFKVKLCGDTSTYYLGSKPTVDYETIVGRTQGNIAAKRIISLKLIER